MRMSLSDQISGCKHMYSLINKTVLCSLLALLSAQGAVYAQTTGVSPASMRPFEIQQFNLGLADSQQQPVLVAVLDLDALGIPDSQAQAISERLRIYLGEHTQFTVLERNKMDDIFLEVNFQLSGACNTDDCIVQIGKVLGVQKMIAGSVSVVGSLYSLQARIIDVESSRIERQAFVDVNGIEDVLQKATKQVADQLLGGAEYKQKSVFVSGLLSSIIPGSGQFYSGRPAMGGVWLVIVGGLGAYTAIKYQDYQNKYDSYQTLHSEYLESLTIPEMIAAEQQLDKEYSTLQSSKDELQIIGIACTVGWALNLIDAIISTSKSRRSTSLSLGIQRTNISIKVAIPLGF